MSDDGEREYYEHVAAQQKIREQTKRMRQKLHPCQPGSCKCACAHCEQARKYDQPKTHCKGR